MGARFFRVYLPAGVGQYFMAYGAGNMLIFTTRVTHAPPL